MQWEIAPLPLPGVPQVHVWSARAVHHDGSARGAEQAQQQRAIGRELLRRALKVHWAIEPHQWRLTHAPTGAPKLAVWVAGSPLQCSLSHADGATLCAVGATAAVGVDVERMRADAGHERLVPLVCSAQEWAQLAACRRPSLQAARFLGLWTLKEARAKACRTGALATESLRALSFDLHHRADVNDEPEAVTRAARPEAAWRFRRFAVGLRHVAALAWRPCEPPAGPLPHPSP
jgi:phosphopantetheinyl transferase